MLAPFKVVGMPRHRAASWLALRAAAALLAALPTWPAPADAPPTTPGHVWLDIAGQPLPFQDDATIREVLRSARVLSREMIPRGVTEPEKLVLEHDGIRFHAAFRSLDITARAHPAGGVTKRPKRYRDAAIFEVGAYELSQLLGIGRVPPVVERTIEGAEGTVQIWVEGTTPEIELSERGLLQPPDPLAWNQQKQIMYVFDSLIANRDRNQGNLLIDGSWNIWFIDHTRAFTQTSRPPHPDKLTRCERQLWRALRAVDEATVRQRLEPYLAQREISDLLKRWHKLVDHFEKQIARHGEDAVLFDLDPPGSAAAARSD